MNFFGPPPTVLQRLERGLVKRKTIEDKFQLDLFNRIHEILSALQQCPEAVAALPSKIADQLSITKPELDEFIRKLENPDNMGRDAIEDIVDPLHNMGRDGDNTLRRTEPGIIPGAASRVLPRSIRNSPRGITRPPGSVASGPEAPGSYRPPSIFPSWLSRSAKPPTDVSATPRPAVREPYASSLESSNPSVDAFHRPPPTASRYSGDLYDVEGGSRRKTRRARKYRNRT